MDKREGRVNGIFNKLLERSWIIGMEGLRFSANVTKESKEDEISELFCKIIDLFFEKITILLSSINKGTLTNGSMIEGATKTFFKIKSSLIEKLPID